MLCFLIYEADFDHFCKSLEFFAKLSMKQKIKFQIICFELFTKRICWQRRFLKCLNDFCVRMTSLDNKSTIPKHSYCLFKKKLRLVQTYTDHWICYSITTEPTPGTTSIVFWYSMFTNCYEKFMKFPYFWDIVVLGGIT